MKKLIIILALLLLFLIAGHSQKQLHLKDTLLDAAAATMTFFAIDSLPTQYAQMVNPRHSSPSFHKLSIQSLIWDSLALEREQYDTVYAYTFIFNNEGDRALRILNRKFDDSAVHHFKDKFDLLFPRKDNETPVNVKVTYEGANEKAMTLKPMIYHFAYVEELDSWITIWPYMLGVLIHMGDSINMKIDFMEEFMINEIIPFDSVRQVRFNSYDFANKRLNYLVEPRQDAILGYKEERYIETSTLTSDGLTIFYFGRNSCRLCDDEIPKLTKLQDLSRKKSFDLKVILTYQEGDEQEAQAYYDRYLKPIDVVFSRIDDSIIHDFNVYTYPTYIAVDPDGHIKLRSDVHGKNTHQMLNKLIRQLVF